MLGEAFVHSRRGKVFLVLFIVAAVAMLFLLWLPSMPDVAMPSPNGFDDFVHASQLIQETTMEINKLMDLESLRQFRNDNAEGLRLMRSGLQKECRVRIDRMPTFQTALSNISRQLMSLQKIVPAMIADGRLAELENRTDDALATYLDAVRLTHEMGRGGVMLHKINGLTMERFGLSKLENLATNLSAAQCRRGIRGLESVEGERESLEETAERERTWAFANSNFREKIMLRFFRRTLKQMGELAAKHFRMLQLRSSEVRVSLAVRAFELEQARQPRSISELSPDYLKEVPRNPENGQELSLPKPENTGNTGRSR